MKKNFLLTSMAITLIAGNLHASGANDNKSVTNPLTNSSIQDMKRQHREMTQGALSKGGMEARSKLIFSNKDEIYHEMIKAGDITISKSDQFSADQFIH